jgi:hypothetical protein
VVSACGRSRFSTRAISASTFGCSTRETARGVIAVAHVGKQGAEVRLVDAQLLLHFGMGQAHLAAHHPPAMGHVVLDVHPLDGVGGVGVVDAEDIAQRFDRLAGPFGVAQLRQRSREKVIITP